MILTLFVIYLLVSYICSSQAIYIKITFAIKNLDQLINHTIIDLFLLQDFVLIFANQD